VFVKVRHEVRCNERPPRRRGARHRLPRRLPQPGERAAAQEAAPRRRLAREIVPDDVLLFRYSALTFNGHRIHYDRRYVTGVEGYPGLIVHGPLIATLLMDLLRRECRARRLARFRFRAVRPTFDLHPFRVHGPAPKAARGAWAQDHEGWLTMDASGAKTPTAGSRCRPRPCWP
jgi:3-methylfumaryl-CoA hydratase